MLLAVVRRKPVGVLSRSGFSREKVNHAETFLLRHPGSGRGPAGLFQRDADTDSHRYSVPDGHAGAHLDAHPHSHANAYGNIGSHGNFGSYGDATSGADRRAGAYGISRTHGSNAEGDCGDGRYRPPADG